MSGIRLSEKHGVNPSLDICPWCGESMGIILFGRMKGDREAPRQVVSGYEPCDSCKAKMSQGIALIECVEKPVGENQVPIQEGLYPTGRWVVVTEEAIVRMVNPAMVPGILKCGKAFIDQPVMDMLLKQQANLEKEIEDED